MAAATTTIATSAPRANSGFETRKLVAFIAMVFGMFMAILDIQIVSASLTEIQAGLAASSNEITWVQTAYLISEVVMIPLSGFLSRALGTRTLFAISATNLQGVYDPDHDAFAWLRTRKPIAVLGHAMFIYDVTRDADALRKLSDGGGGR